MPRRPREWVSGEYGSVHIVSRTAGDAIWFDDQEKECLKKMLLRFAAGFYIHIHAFCIMNNHFHILLTCREKDAQNASAEKLLQRYKKIYGENASPPQGSLDKDGIMLPDEDGGIQRLRTRLGSLSCFVQELKQTYSRWYNKRHDRKGYLWGNRFKSVIVDKGEARLVCSAYIDLNPLRAGIVTQPEIYRWSSMGLRARQPASASRILHSIFEPDQSWPEPNAFAQLKKEGEKIAWYRQFVYLSGGIERKGKAHIATHLIQNVMLFHGHMGVGTALRFRVRNISEGIAMGSQPFIAGFQQKSHRKIIRPRAFLQGNRLYATRVLRLKTSASP